MGHKSWSVINIYHVREPLRTASTTIKSNIRKLRRPMVPPLYSLKNHDFATLASLWFKYRFWDGSMMDGWVYSNKWYSCYKASVSCMVASIVFIAAYLRIMKKPTGITVTGVTVDSLHIWYRDVDDLSVTAERALRMSYQHILAVKQMSWTTSPR